MWRARKEEYKMNKKTEKRNAQMEKKAKQLLKEVAFLSSRHFATLRGNDPTGLAQQEAEYERAAAEAR